jgi:hypothetical protein
VRRAALRSTAFCTLAFWTWAGTAAADEPTVRECISANETAQDFRQAGRLGEARKKLALCVSASCPGPVRKDCARRLGEVDAAMPTLVMEVTDDAGHDLDAVRVRSDGQPFADRLDGTPIAIDPGEHRFTFEAAGIATAEKTILVHERDKGRHERISLSPATVRPANAASTSALPNAAVAPAVGGQANAPSQHRIGATSARGTGMPTFALVALGVGAAGWVVGIAAGIAGDSKHAALEGECQANGDCPPTAQPDIDGFHSLKTASTVGYIVGFVAIAGGVSPLADGTSWPRAGHVGAPLGGAARGGADGHFLMMHARISLGSSVAAVLAISVTGCPQVASDDWRIAQDDGSLGSEVGDTSTLPEAADASSPIDALGANNADATLGESGSPDSSDAGCMSPGTDANCGACGYACVGARHCMSGRCTPAWLPMSTVNAPGARTTQGAVVGGRLVVAGGYVACSGALATAAAYDSVTDMWTALPDLNTGRSQHTVVSSGTSVFAFGGLTDCANGGTQVPTLEEWTPGDLAWTTVTASNAPAGRYDHESAWTGSTLFVYGGASGTLSYVTSGAVYDPILNVWSDASCALPGCARNAASVFVDQGVVRLWGGSNGGTVTGDLSYSSSDGGWNVWTPPAAFPVGILPIMGNPADDGRRIYLPSGGGEFNLDVVIYDRQTQTATTDTATSVATLSPAGATGWTGAEVVLWSGAGTNGPTTAGGRYQPPAPP